MFTDAQLAEYHEAGFVHLHAVPGSHREPVHDHVDDRRPGANYGYREIVDYDFSAATPVLM